MSRQSGEICYVVDSGELFRLVALHFHMHAEGKFDVIQSIHLLVELMSNFVEQFMKMK
jgi:hypothetical protein